MTRRRLLCIALAAACLTGCANFRLGLPGAIGASPDSPHEAAGELAHDSAGEVAALLANYRRLRALSSDEQRPEVNAAQLAFERTPNDATRLELALALLLPHAPWRDEARLRQLLSGIEAAPGQPGAARHDLAQLLLELLAERQRERYAGRRKLEQLTRQLREERQKTDDMQQKIDSLRAIDRDMMLQRKAP